MAQSININAILGVDLKSKIEENKLYRMAFTHSSYANENKLPYSYERLEFLGDAILSSHISIFVFHHFQEKNEGELTSLRSKAVRQETLAVASFVLGLQKYLFLGNGEKATGGQQRISILSDIFESFLAVVYLDLGPDVVNAILKVTLFNWLMNEQLESIIDYKTKLQEFIQSEKYEAVSYRVIEQYRMDSTTYFKIGVYWENDVLLGIGSDTTKKKAEQKAAKMALEKFIQENKTKKPKEQAGSVLEEPKKEKSTKSSKKEKEKEKEEWLREINHGGEK